MPWKKNTFKMLYFKKTESSNFAETIKIATVFNKATFGDSIKGKRIRNYVLNAICIYIF